MALNKFILTILCFTLVSSCSQNDILIEKKKVVLFESLKSSMEKVVTHVVNNYYSLGTIKGYNQLQFVLGSSTYQRNNIFSDSVITKLVKNSDILFITFEKSSQCLEKYQYDLVRFKLKSKGAQYQYYYVYQFCPLFSSNNVVNTANFKSIPLGSNWFLDIEKS